MSNGIIHHYNAEHHSTRSANALMPALYEIFRPTSVLDVGCGVGHWAKAFLENGVEDVYGIDGAHVEKRALQIPEGNFLAYDLNDIGSLSLNRKYSLAICLEVAEHLPEQKAADLVNFLVKHADYIMFSAAIPFQTGENHLNEQPFDYWQALFNENGYVMVDPFRKRFWNDERINWWYRQNLFLVVPVALQNKCGLIYDGNVYVHPEMLKMYVGTANQLHGQNSIIKEGSIFESVKKYIGRIHTKNK